MNTIHDLGGMDGFTLMERDKGFPLKEQWERDIWGLALALWASRSWPSRADIERLPPDLYLRMPYYAKWLQTQENSLVNRGMVTREELENPNGPMQSAEAAGIQPASPEAVVEFFMSDSSYEVTATEEPRFSVGDEVVVKNEHPTWHTRVPRYVRGHSGVIYKHHGMHVFGDEVPESQHPGPQHLYTVMFLSKELWGDRGNKNDRIFAELTEFHLEAVS